MFNGVNDSYEPLVNLCNQKKHSVITTTGNMLFVRFKADYSLQKRGFNASFTSKPTSKFIFSYNQMNIKVVIKTASNVYLYMYAFNIIFCEMISKTFSA